VRGINHAPRTPALSLLPGGPQASLIGAGQLAGSFGETLTFTRATTKYALDGSFQVASGQPCVGSKGLLVEAAHTNYILQSQAIDNAAWTKQSGTVVTANAAAAPDGTLTADFIQVGNSGQYIYQLVIGPTGNFALSCWIKRVSTSGNLRIQNPATSAKGDWLVDFSLLSDSWERITDKHPAVTVTSAFADSGTVSGWRMDSGDVASLQFYLWGVQEEGGLLAHSYVPTAGVAVTSDADLASLPITNLPVAAGTVELDFTPNWSFNPSAWALAAGDAFLLGSSDGSTDGVSLAINSVGTPYAFVGGNQVFSSAQVWVAGQTYRMRLVWGAGAVSIYRDDVLLVNSTGLTINVAYAAGETIGHNGGSYGPAEGHISNLRVFA
jgi:hypothetical protein